MKRYDEIKKNAQGCGEMNSTLCNFCKLKLNCFRILISRSASYIPCKTRLKCCCQVEKRSQSKVIFKQVSLFSVRSLLFEMLEKNHSNYDWILCPNMSNSIVLLLTLALKNKELHFWQAIVKKDEEYIGFTSRPLKAIAWDNMFYLDIALVLEERYKVWTP